MKNSEKSYIYVIGPKQGNLQKIGLSKHPEKRLKELQTGNPEKLVLHYTREIEENRVLLMEQQIHKELRYLKSREKSEWFNISPENAVSEIDFNFIRWEDDPALGKF